LARETPVTIKAISTGSDLFHTGLVSELSSKALKEKFWTKEEMLRLGVMDTFLKCGKDEINQIGEVRSFLGFDELKEGDNGMISLE
jgi:hypothetical protein